jgi:hypothetical protein
LTSGMNLDMIDTTNLLVNVFTAIGSKAAAD